MPPLVLDGTNGVSGVDGTASNPAIEGTDSNTGIFYPAADTVAIGTGGTERVRVSSAGVVGVNTTSPAAIGANYGTIDIRGSSGGGFNLGTTGTLTGQIYGNSGGITYDAQGALTHFWYTNATERARITSGGDWLVGTTASVTGSGASISTNGRTASCTLSIQAHNAAGYDAKLYLECPGSNAGWITYVRSNSRLYASNQTENSGPYVAANGTSWTTGSDARLKINVQELNYGLSSVLALVPKEYEYKVDQSKKCFGFIAQDIIDVIPEIVDAPEDADEMMGIQYQGIIPVLVKAIQELNAKVDAQAAEIAALKGNA